MNDQTQTGKKNILNISESSQITEQLESTHSCSRGRGPDLVASSPATKPVTATTAAEMLFELSIHAVDHIVAVLVIASAESIVCVYTIVATVVGDAVRLFGVPFHVNLTYRVVLVGDAGGVLVAVESRQDVQRRAQAGLHVVCILLFFELFQLVFDLVAYVHDGVHVPGQLLEESSLFSHYRGSFLDQVAVGTHVGVYRVGDSQSMSD